MTALYQRCRSGGTLHATRFYVLAIVGDHRRPLFDPNCDGASGLRASPSRNLTATELLDRVSCSIAPSGLDLSQTEGLLQSNLMDKAFEAGHCK